MDPLSITASIVALAGITDTAFKRGYRLVKQVKMPMNQLLLFSVKSMSSEASCTNSATLPINSNPTTYVSTQLLKSIEYALVKSL